MIHIVTVAVALERPPVPAAWRKYVVETGTCGEATAVALQMAACTSVMPVEVVSHSLDCDTITYTPGGYPE